METNPQNSLVFNFPFQKEVYRSQMNLSFSLAWNKALKKSRLNFFASIAAFLFGALAIYGQGNIGYIFIFVGIYGFLDVFRIYKAHNRSKVKYDKVIDKLAFQHLNATEDMVWGFLDDAFTYKDSINEMKIRWKGFESFTLLGDNLFLKLNSGQSFILAKEKAGSEDFGKIMTFLEDKISSTKDGNQ